MNDAGAVRVRIIGDDSNLKNTLSDSSVQLAKYGAAAALAAAAVTTALVKSGLSSADALATSNHIKRPCYHAACG